MRTDIKEAWVEALESGEYVQGHAALTIEVGDDRRDCCLGVLCDLAVRAGVIEWPVVDQDRGIFHYGSGSVSDVLPPEVMEWAGLGNSNPSVVVTAPAAEIVEEYEPGDSSGLAHLNDSGVPFRLIAQMIRESL